MAAARPTLAQARAAQARMTAQIARHLADTLDDQADLSVDPEEVAACGTWIAFARDCAEHFEKVSADQDRRG